MYLSIPPFIRSALIITFSHDFPIVICSISMCGIVGHLDIFLIFFSASLQLEAKGNITQKFPCSKNSTSVLVCLKILFFFLLEKNAVPMSLSHTYMCIIFYLYKHIYVHMLSHSVVSNSLQPIGL